jgi:hypothetical protein
VERKDAIFTVIQEIISSEFDSIRPISVIKNDVKVSINSKSQEKLFATENIATEHWACNGKNHWIEILVPKDMVATELKMQIKELRSYTPKDLQISMISAPIILQGPINPLIQKMQLFCDSSCLGGHDPDAECTVCKTLYEDHTPTSHYCSGTNTRGSFPLQKPTSADYPADSLIKVKTTKVDSTQSEFSLLNFSDCVTLQPGLIRIEVLSAQSASECRMSGLKLFGTKLQAVPWKCMLCYEVNSVDNTKLLCEVKLFCYMYSIIYHYKLTCCCILYNSNVVFANRCSPSIQTFQAHPLYPLLPLLLLCPRKKTYHMNPCTISQ